MGMCCNLVYSVRERVCGYLIPNSVSHVGDNFRRFLNVEFFSHVGMEYINFFFRVLVLFVPRVSETLCK